MAFYRIVVFAVRGKRAGNAICRTCKLAFLVGRGRARGNALGTNYDEWPGPGGSKWHCNRDRVQYTAAHSFHSAAGRFGDVRGCGLQSPQPGVYTGTLQLFTTDPAQPDLVVSLMGEGMLAPMDPFILLDFPREDEWITELPITFQWELLEGPGDTTASFTLWIRALTPDSNSLPVPYSTGTATSYALNDPAYGEGRYLWWVTAVWPGGALQSPLRHLHLGELPPPPPVFELLSPENEATITLPNGTFVWSTLPYPNVPAQACVYQLWVIPADSVNGDDVPLSVSTADTTVTVDLSAFEGQDRCFWFVIAHL